ncbi:MAG: restriction endonuclease subunit S, partial [Chloroflexota bacterium]
MTDATRNLLKQHFDTAFAAPDGIAKLRELILTLAMQGKLVDQDPNDPPASELLKEIEAEKQRLTFSSSPRRRGSSKPLPPIKPEEVPYQLPQGWEWVRLEDVSTKIHYGFTASADHSAQNVRLLRITDIQDNKVDWETVPACNARKEDVEQYLLADNDILIARTGGTVGKSYLVQGINVDAVFASYLIRVVPSSRIAVRFIKYFEEGPLYWRQLYAACSGTGQPNVNGTSLSQLLLALPPLPEQHRIVARIDQLMARCDALEKLRKEREEKRLAVHAAAIKQLLDAPDGSAWDFIGQHFGELYTAKENVAGLRKAILQLAVMGRLVPQDAGDPPAGELLKEIEAEKQRLLKAGKIKKPKPLPPIKPEEVPYQLPQGWVWVRFEDVVEIGSGITKGRKLDGRKVISIPYLRVANVQRGFLDLDEIKEIEIPLEEANKYQLINGDLLITEGGDWDKVGRTCIWKEEISLCGHQNHIFRARKLLDCQNEIWLEKYLNSSIARGYFASASKQTTN